MDVWFLIGILSPNIEGGVTKGDAVNTQDDDRLGGVLVL
jgi:hypothetical protein